MNLCEVSRKFTGRAARVRVENKKLLVIEQLIHEKVERKIYDGYEGVEFVEERKTSEYWKTAVVLNLYDYGRETLGRLHHVVGNVNNYTLGMFVDREVNKTYYENK